MTDTTAKLSQAGVSIWLDDLSRSLIATGTFMAVAILTVLVTRHMLGA